MPPAEEVRSFLGWAFVISIALHLILGPVLGHYKPPREDKPEVEKVSVTKKIRIIVPTPPPPTPPPTPTPTPPPPKEQTPPPVKSTNPPPQPKLKLNVTHLTAKSKSGPSERKYVAPPVGSEAGVPQGNAASGPVTTAAPAAPPGPPATAKPACAQPHVDATVIKPVEPDYPDIARQQGATGTVHVKVTLSTGGDVTAASVYKSSGNPALDEAAVKAAQGSSYSPEIDNCQPIAGSYLFRADFTGQ